ncbi:MAG: MASE1 domain-containing protein [Deltaproteobacteria bacterium]|nr:MASE1 domain-containing protein [Deltaproteobacteria bacterium]
MTTAATPGARATTRLLAEPWPRSLLVGALVTLVYALTGVAGLDLAHTAPNAIAIWPPTGVAIAAVFLCGARLWPAVFAGALIVNLWVGASLPVAAAIATGNTLEALLAGAILRRVGFDARLQRPRDLVWFGVTCAFAPIASAVTAATALPLGGEAAWQDAPAVARIWWLGNATSALLIAPVVMVWSRRPDHGRRALARPWSWVEAASLGLLLTVTMALAADRDAADPFARTVAQLIAFPLMIWSGARFGARGATAATLLAVVVAIWRTLSTMGPEDGAAIAEMWFHMTVLGASALVAASLSERERLAASLGDNEARVRSLVSSAPVCIKELSLDGRILSINPAGVALFGARAASDVVGADYLAFLGPAEREVCAEALRAVAAGESRVVEIAVAGAQFESTFAPVRDDAGEVVRVVAHALDLSHRKRAEEERIRLNRQLLDAQKLESLGLLAGGVAHDFNNLLLAIHGNAEVAAADPRDVACVRESLAAIELAASRATELCRSMLALSGKGHFELATLDLAAELAALKALLATTWPATVALELALPGDAAVAVAADATQLRQLLLNLLTNAADATSARGGERRVRVTLSVRDTGPDAYEPTRRSPAMQPGRFAVVEVEDDGVGMAADVVERMFEPFYTTKGTSRGLGLAATLGTVRGHRGAIAVASRPGAGTRFEVALPLSDAEPAPPAPEAPPREPGDGAPTLLVVDDEPLLLGLSQRMLERAGYTVLTAETGEAALALLEGRDDVALALLDLTMPGLGGVETCRRLRARHPALRIVLSSGFDAEAGLAHEELGHDAFIGKPYARAQLFDLIDEVLRRDAR